MLVERFNRLRTRLDDLAAGRPPPMDIITRARLLFTRAAPDASLPVLHALDRALDGAGVHTSADARLLRDLGQSRGRLSQLARGLVAQATGALDEFEDALTLAEQRAALDQLEGGSLLGLEASFVKLARVVKVAAVFAAPASAPVAFELFSRGVGSAERAAPVGARVAIAEFLAERARGNVVDSAQKRRDVDLAYELVLRMSAEAKEDRERLRKLRIELAEAKSRVRSSPPVRSIDELSRHVRHAARVDPRTAYRSLRALYERAVEGGDAELARVAHLALGSLSASQGPRAMSEAVERDQARRVLGFRDAPVAGVDEPAPGGRAGLTDELGDALAQLAFSLDENEQRAIEMAAGAGRFFDVEDTLSEELVEAETRTQKPVHRRVPYPTQQMSYEYTGSLEEVHNFVISHPGSLILDLAAGRQMVRSYVEEEAPRRPRRVKKTAVRVYVLDASGSMHGARARFRDAILVAELNAIRIKARVALPFDPLYFSYFNDSPTELVRVDSGGEATRHIEKLFARSPAEGQTDITLALMSAFESIHRAQGKDPYLARATVVLVTDGEDGVDLELIRRTRKPFEGLDIALSFISLGEENTDLKSLVLEQREAGGRAFYHHLSDAEIQLVRTEFDSAWRTLVPLDMQVGPDALERLAPHLEALEALAERRPAPGPVRSESQFDTLFPKAAGAPHPAAARLRPRVSDVLDAIADAASLASPERRAAEAVELLVHLLALYQIPVPAYLEVAGDPSLAPAVARVRLLCRPFD